MTIRNFKAKEGLFLEEIVIKLGELFDFKLKDLGQRDRWLVWSMMGGMLFFSAVIMIGYYWEKSETSASSQQLEQTSSVPPGSQVLFCTNEQPEDDRLTMYVDKGPMIVLDMTKRDETNWCGTMTMKDVPGYRQVLFSGNFKDTELLWIAIGWPDNIVGMTSVRRSVSEPIVFRNGIAPPVFPAGRLINLEQIQRISIN